MLQNCTNCKHGRIDTADNKLYCIRNPLKVEKKNPMTQRCAEWMYDHSRKGEGDA